ncbi:metallophosphoesterase [Zunongwangia atlantica]|uniref:Metallophosphoesterase domain-containing protein n=1 Tax=Zunongwangia atlantica 22II14-10F7 TaxID=1185767 RepID=A0A1Y1T233_9FLAO|nr:metallophosphoesterase [Zunongwangia atlantica]ORL44645.1 metallophosphoesterase domain-containing protein [Zunongwangia atlantica 22II14-10F7]
MRWLLFIAFYLLIDIYAYQALRSLNRSWLVAVVYFLISLLVIGNFVYQWQSSGGGFFSAIGFAFGIVLAFLLAKLVLVIFMFGEDIVRFFIGIFKAFSGTGYKAPGRRKFVSQIALGLAAIPFVSVLYGMFKGRYDFRVLKYTLYFEDLPKAFDGYRIGQISDVHSGSFDNHEKVAYGVNLLKEQETDVVFFTGDLVNNKATEMKDWKSLFSTISAKDGVYSILGNHDYGDYVNWNSDSEKEQNLNDLKTTHAEMGWDLLLNEHRYLEKNGEKIAIVGVENWGGGHFKKAGDLDLAGKNVADHDFKILLSHDPSHWQEKVKDHNKFYHLTLSGHTHGMQFGIEIPGFLKWSPAKYRYKNWAGIYKENNRYINVNRGFGYLAFPGRVGMWPEISVIELRKGAAPA